MTLADEAPEAETVGEAVAGRSCNGCTLCCKLMRVDEIDKPWWTWCPDCDVGKGCRIYATRPEACRIWLCGYLHVAAVPDAWYPPTSHMVLDVRDDPHVAVEVYVDSDHADAWRGEPFHSGLKDTAAEEIERNRWVRVQIGARQIIVLPDRDLDLGKIEDDETVAFPAGRPDGRVPWKMKRPIPRR